MTIKLKQTKNKALNKDVNKIITQIKKGYKPEKIILFGSFACGRPKENSDVDLVVIKETRERPFQRMMKTAKIVKSPLGADILIYTPKEWATALKEQNFFIEEIAKKGKTVYVRK